jgi:hypothetical protein
MGKTARTAYAGEFAESELSPIGRAREELSEAVLAVGATIGSLPEVHAVLWNTEGQYIRVVTAVMEYSDESLERVAEKELELMDALPEFLLEFRVVRVERVSSFLRAGYATVLGRQTEQTGPARSE